jgi:hypothetical protein
MGTPDEPVGPPRPLIFIHVQKTAGRSFETLLRTHYRDPIAYRFDSTEEQYLEFAEMTSVQRDAYDLLDGHCNYGIHSLLSRKATYLTLLRDPVERMISRHHHFITRNRVHPFAQQGGSLADFVRDICPDNEHVRWLSSVPSWQVPLHETSREMLDEAKHNLEHEVEAFGIAERFAESLEVMAPIVGWRGVAPIRINVGDGRQARDTLDLETERLIRDRNALDLELYEFATSLFAERLREARARTKRERGNRTLARRLWPRRSGLNETAAVKQAAPPAISALTPASRQRAADGRRAPIVAATHWKAGSQWIRGIFESLAPGETVEIPRPAAMPDRLEPGVIYSPAYIYRRQLDTLRDRANARIFFVIRDPRDTLVSLYFSLLASHYPRRAHATRRDELAVLSPEEGLLHLIESDAGLERSAQIQRSWIGSGTPRIQMLRFEDLVTRDVELLVPLLADHCKIGVHRDLIEKAVIENRFEKLSGGRAAGEEEASAHYRKGVAGDWHNYFSPPVTAAFKKHYGNLLIAAGYERDFEWEADPRLAARSFGEDPVADLARLTAERSAILKAYANLTELFVTRDEQLSQVRSLAGESLPLLDRLAEQARRAGPLGHDLETALRDYEARVKETGA